MPAQCQKVKEVGDLMTGKPANEAPVNRDRNCNGPKVAKFLVGKLCSEINEISKEVPRWSYDLVDELEVLMDASPKESQIRSPKDDRVVLFNSKTDSNDNQNSAEPDRNTEFAVVRYSREPGYFRDLIRGYMHPQRRKTVTYKLFQGTAHSPLFFRDNGRLRVLVW
ncbi:hypothetical protein RYX36_035686 [Vicia faba]